MSRLAELLDAAFPAVSVRHLERECMFELVRSGDGRRRGGVSANRSRDGVELAAGLRGRRTEQSPVPFRGVYYAVIRRLGVSTLTDAEATHFREDGYVRVENAVPETDCEAVVDAIWDFLGKDPDDPETWYGPPEGLDGSAHGQSAGMVNLYHHQSLWDVRQQPDLYEAFADLLGESRLWTSIDRCNMTPPSHENHPEQDTSFVHWDVDTSPLPDRPVGRYGTAAVPFGVQGVLYLEDTTDEMGGFQCVPELYRDLDRWVRAQPDDRDPWDPDIGEYEVESIPGEQGDVVVWNSLLPHGNGHNTSADPRLAQYVRMYPARPADEEAREQRVESWRDQEAPVAERRDPRGRERERYERAELTPLGERLLGLREWD